MFCFSQPRSGVGSLHSLLPPTLPSSSLVILSQLKWVNFWIKHPCFEGRKPVFRLSDDLWNVSRSVCFRGSTNIVIRSASYRALLYPLNRKYSVRSSAKVYRYNKSVVTVLLLCESSLIELNKTERIPHDSWLKFCSSFSSLFAALNVTDRLIFFVWMYTYVVDKCLLCLCRRVRTESTTLLAHVWLQTGEGNILFIIICMRVSQT
jgi:hypothetical protein